MPIYIFEHPKTKKVVEIVQGIHEEHTYTDKKGVKWNRVFTVPNAVIDGAPDPFSINAFDDKTKKAKGTMKDLWARSEELSQKRAAKRDGVDPVKQEYFKEYAKSHRGNPHPSQNAEKEYTI